MSNQPKHSRVRRKEFYIPERRLETVKAAPLKITLAVASASALIIASGIYLTLLI